ncbi:hypothetical protein DL93DRAFT_2085255 [Clavulina sp. PMI_390]|nr:hypothetical protein DL93DRAFT_2085255 [Clavulina sp. PMI_390]
MQKLLHERKQLFSERKEKVGGLQRKVKATKLDAASPPASLISQTPSAAASPTHNLSLLSSSSVTTHRAAYESALNERDTLRHLVDLRRKELADRQLFVTTNKEDVAQLHIKVEFARQNAALPPSPIAPVGAETELVVPPDVAMMLIPKLGTAYGEILHYKLV